MPGSPDAPADPAQGDVLRFEFGSRLVHWVHAAPFLFLLLSGLILFLPPVKAAHVDGYRIVPLLHVVVGILFIASPIPLYLRLRTNTAVGRDLHRLFSLRREDSAWARYAIGAVLGARTRTPPTGKFNLGQKANAVVTVIVTVALMLTGAVLAVNFFTKRVFNAAFVEHVFPLHDLFMLIALPVVLIHIYLAVLNPSTRESLRGIIGGRVHRAWAHEHHGIWLDETDSRDR